MINYTLIDNNLITNLRITDGAYRCYNLLLSLCYGEKTTCFPSIKYLATALGRSCRTINRYIKELIETGLIIKRRRGSRSNMYTLLQKKSQQVIEKVEKAVERVKETVNKAKNVYKEHKNNYKKQERPDFNDYDQRDNYNYKNLEAMLLGEMDYNPDLLYQP